MIREEKREYEITVTERLLGSQPLNKKIRSDYISKKALVQVEEAKADCTEEDVEEEEGMVREGQAGETGFYSDPDGIYLLDYQFKGFLKEAGNRLKTQLQIANLRHKLGAYLFVFPRFIWLAEKPDGMWERSLEAVTMKGSRRTLIASEYLEPPVVFRVKLNLILHLELNWDVVEQLMRYGTLHGLGQWRGSGCGRFTWRRIVPAKVTEIKTHKLAA